MRALRHPALALLVLAGCTANVPDGRFRCVDDHGCPTPLHCGSDGLCYHAGVGPDGGAGGMEAGVDANDVDAAVDCTNGCITMTVTNAIDPTLTGMTFSIEGRDQRVPSFGETTDPIRVAYGTDGMLDITHPTLGALSYPVSNSSTWALVIGPDTTGGLATVRFLSTDFASVPSSMLQVHPIDMMSTNDPMAIWVEGDMRPMGPGADPGSFNIAQGRRAAVEVHREADVLLADFDASLLPQNGAYYLAIVGNPAVHLASAHGVRAIPVVPGAHLMDSGPVVFTLNATDKDIDVCQNGAPILTVPQAMLQQGTPGFDPTAPAGMGSTVQFYDHAGGCSGTGDDMREATVEDSTHTLPMATRVLMVIVGRVHTTMWGGAAHAEAPPAINPGTTQTVTYGNGTPFDGVQFGSLADGAIVTVGGQGVLYHEFDTPPDDLTIQFPPAGGSAAADFNWSIRSDAAAVLGTTDGTHVFAYMMDAKFGSSWHLTMMTLPMP